MEVFYFIMAIVFGTLALTCLVLSILIWVYIEEIKMLMRFSHERRRAKRSWKYL